MKMSAENQSNELCCIIYFKVRHLLLISKKLKHTVCIQEYQQSPNLNNKVSLQQNKTFLYFLCVSCLAKKYLHAPDVCI